MVVVSPLWRGPDNIHGLVLDRRSYRRGQITVQTPTGTAVSGVWYRPSPEERVVKSCNKLPASLGTSFSILHFQKKAESSVERSPSPSTRIKARFPTPSPPPSYHPLTFTISVRYSNPCSENVVSSSLLFTIIDHNLTAWILCTCNHTTTA